MNAAEFALEVKAEIQQLQLKDIDNEIDYPQIVKQAINTVKSRHTDIEIAEMLAPNRDLGKEELEHIVGGLSAPVSLDFFKLCELDDLE